MHAWEQIQSTVDYIEAHLGEDLDTAELARMAGLSPFYFQRLFRRLVKRPVAEYVKLRRMARAADSLPGGNTRILDLALELGFSSHEHFSRTFMETFGMTPSDYRAHPCALNRMTKPELLLQYTLVDEGVPLVSGGIVLEMSRRQLTEPAVFWGLEQRMPVSFVEGLGVESGADPLDGLWRTLHEKTAALGIADGEGIGVAHPCETEGYFCYFAGASAEGEAPPGLARWVLEPGRYVVCAFEAESFSALVMDALYKAQQYVFSTWLPNHGLQTEPFCAERYPGHAPETTSMEIWLKILE